MIGCCDRLLLPHAIIFRQKTVIVLCYILHVVHRGTKKYSQGEMRKVLSLEKRERGDLYCYGPE